MVNCAVCDDPVVLPYTCSLCKNRHCGKHRLPESHSCKNIALFQTQAYRKQKSQKLRDRKISTIADFSGGAEYGGRSSRFGNVQFWSSGNLYQDAALGGVILAGAAILRRSISISFPSLITIATSFLFGALGFVLVYAIRRRAGENYGVTSSFVIWPIGIAITLITSLLFFTFLAFGTFLNTQRGSLRGEAITGLYTIYSFIGLSLISRILVPNLALTNEILLGIDMVSRMFIWFALLLILPWGDLDGVKIYNYDRRTFWISLAVIIILFLSFR